MDQSMLTFAHQKATDGMTNDGRKTGRIFFPPQRKAEPKVRY